MNPIIMCKCAQTEIICHACPKREDPACELSVAETPSDGEDIDEEETTETELELTQSDDRRRSPARWR